MQSLRMVLPAMPMLSALSAAHLAAILFPPTLRRLYVARDDDPAGNAAHDTLRDRAYEADIDVIPRHPGSEISTMICGFWASIRSGLQFESSSFRRTSRASC